MAYDELYDANKVRPIYSEYLTQHQKRTPASKKRAQQNALAGVSGDAAYLPMARLMSSRDYRQISRGVEQRARALQLFLTDYYFGTHSYRKAKLFSRTELETIVREHAHPRAPKPPRLENIQFWYAPDIIRDASGDFRVIEDNIGFVGGIGDLMAFAEASSHLGAPLSASRSPEAFYKRMVASYRREAKLCGGGKTILLSYPRTQRWNHEDERLERIFEGLDVTAVTNLRTLKVRRDGLYHSGERVGFVILNVSFDDIEPSSTFPNRVANFWDAVGKRQLGVSYAPGLEFVGDKSFCPYVEKLVKFYLGEECILPTLPVLHLQTSRSQGQVRIERESWVIKSKKGQSGESVWLGNHMSQKDWALLLKRVSKSPKSFIAQRFCEPSQFLGHAVDLRPLAIVTPQRVTVSPIPWGRAAKKSDGKTNISYGGLLAPIVIV